MYATLNKNQGIEIQKKWASGLCAKNWTNVYHADTECSLRLVMVELWNRVDMEW